MAGVQPQHESSSSPQQHHQNNGTTIHKPSRAQANVFHRKDAYQDTIEHDSNGYDGENEKGTKEKKLPQYNEAGQRINHQGHVVHKYIEPDGESGRRYFSPLKFLAICWRSTSTASKCTNVLWPFTIAAMVMHFGFPQHHLWVFITCYLGMVPAANLVGFAGQEFARKLPKVMGIILETTLGSVVEIILFMVLITRKSGNFQVIRAAILGSILANLLFCLGKSLFMFFGGCVLCSCYDAGVCFFVGGIFHPQQTFHEAISEVGSNLMLVAAVALVIPTIYYQSLSGGRITEAALEAETLRISRAAAIILLVAFCVYVWFQSRSHHSLYEDILEADEELDHDRHKDLAKAKLTATEGLIAVLVALTFVSFMAVFLVEELDYMRDERGISDAFLGLILIPIVEKASEHLTAVDEAYDNQMNFALSHVLGASIQTALLNTPLVILVGWGLHKDMALNFELFDAVVLILAIIVVGNFLRDEKSDYLEGALCVFVYILIAVTAWYYPNPVAGTETASANQAAVGLAGRATKGAVGMMMRA
ncbi:hypothetical protein LTR62_008862 [Meristemomyces frigidus]|uniref:Sodium/calcium exchanger membrane region domain-containing protein n=1 Tax=Meristemomyces frigidus TaxID=1508187 RepID=A0AAN7YCD3_9PEZI|nr:hypothetical protein LTR62_008862 [Meristemomyces frigidus]